MPRLEQSLALVEACLSCFAVKCVGRRGELLPSIIDHAMAGCRSWQCLVDRGAASRAVQSFAGSFASAKEEWLCRDASCTLTPNPFAFSFFSYLLHDKSRSAS
jgi:hypothetical protein